MARMKFSFYTFSASDGWFRVEHHGENVRNIRRNHKFSHGPWCYEIYRHGVWKRYFASAPAWWIKFENRRHWCSLRAMERNNEGGPPEKRLRGRVGLGMRNSRHDVSVALPLMLHICWWLGLSVCACVLLCAAVVVVCQSRNVGYRSSDVAFVCLMFIAYTCILCVPMRPDEHVR